MHLSGQKEYRNGIAVCICNRGYKVSCTRSVGGDRHTETILFNPCISVRGKPASLFIIILNICNPCPVEGVDQVRNRTALIAKYYPDALMGKVFCNSI